MSDHAVVLFVNEQFYVAFASRDVRAMAEVWSREDGVTCIHPGWAPLIGRDAVMQSWRAILTNPNSPAIVCRNASARVVGDAAYVVCYEQIDRSFLVATNVFRREADTWKMVHHQAGACPSPELEDDPSPGGRSLQ